MRDETITTRRKRNGTFASVVYHPDPILAAEECSLSFVSRFLSKVRKTESCWHWTGATKDNGMGCLSRARESDGLIRANRAAWILYNGEIPDGMRIFSICPARNSVCVNPNHMWLGSRLITKKDRLLPSEIKPMSSEQLNRVALLCEQAGLVESEILATWKITHIVPSWMLDEGFTESFADRFWSRVNKTESCWIWTAARNADGYGQIGSGVEKGGHVSAHRASWMLNRGPIPEGLGVLHNCPGGDNRACCNPDHLWLGTPGQNSVDAAKKSKKYADRHWNAKLSYTQMNEIRKAFKSGGITKAELARKFGVTPAHIFKLINHQRGYDYFKIRVSGAVPESTHTGNTI